MSGEEDTADVVEGAGELEPGDGNELRQSPGETLSSNSPSVTEEQRKQLLEMESTRGEDAAKTVEVTTNH